MFYSVCCTEISSYEALRCAVAELYNLEDFETERLGEGFFSDVYRVTHRGSGRLMVLRSTLSNV